MRQGPASDSATNFLLAGVGGQGVLLAADVVALVGMSLGLDVKKSEVHGMAQRGGSVISHVRWGPAVQSPLISSGQADYLVAFERLEALRYAELLRPGGTVLISAHRIPPVSVSSGSSVYPSEREEDVAYAGSGLQRLCVPAIDLAREIGQARVHNVVMLGALASLLNIPRETWLKVISQRVPARFREINQSSFIQGWQHVANHLQGNHR